MSSAAAALLDQLMGRSRNAVVGEDVSKDHWSDPEVCKYFLCGFCPSELFTNTRSDIGPCDKIHDEALQIAYTGSSKFGKMGYEDEFLECLERNIRDLDKRIQRGKERLARSAEANKKAFSEEGGNMYSERLHELSAQIADLISQSEELGNQGDVDAAQELISKVEDLEKEKERERSAVMFKANVPQTVAGFEIDPGNFHEKNEICDVCGCFLIIGDTQARMDAHLMGKQHMGFARIRSKIVELKQSREEKMAKEAEERKLRRESRSNREGSSERGSRRSSHRSRSRDKRRSRSRDKRRRSRSRDLDRSGRSRSRDRDRSRRSRSRDRDRSRRSRSRERKRSRDRRHRSRSGDRRHRSKSRERRRSRSRDSKRRRRSRSRSRERSKRDRRRSRSRDRSHRDRHRSRSKSKERKEETAEREKNKDNHTVDDHDDVVKNSDETTNGIES